MDVQINLFPRRVEALLSDPDKAVATEIERRGLLVANEARRLAPVDTGKLRASIRLDLVERDGERVAIVGSDLAYAVFVHEGTGVYGPRGAPIVPVRAKILAWRRGGRWHFAKQVQGQRPQPFLRSALNVLPR